MKRRGLAAILAAGWILSAAQSLGLDGQNFVRAVRDADNGKALDLLESGGPSVINARDSKGDTALIVAVGKRDSSWTSFLLNNDADPNLANRDGDTPLIVAARIGYESAAEWLLAKGAKVDQPNRMGETPLIVAVHQRRPDLVKLFLSKGADPDKTDNAAGYSARDYAKRDTRTPELLRLIEARDKEKTGKTP